MTAAATHPKGKGSWYFTYTRSCVICGATQTERERRDGPKPEDPMQRYEFVEYGCQGHFC